MTRASTIGLPALALAVTVAFWPGFLAPAETAKWILLIAAAPLLWCLAPRARLEPLALVLGGAWLGWLAVSLTWTPSPADGVTALLRYTVLACAFAIGGALPPGTFRRVLLAVALGGAVNAIAALAQALAGQPPLGLMGNPNLLAELGLIGCIACLAAMGRRRPGRALAAALLPLNAIALLGATWPPSTKTVFVGVAAALLAMLIRRRRPLELAGAVLGPALLLAGMAYLEGGSLTSYGFRLNIWTDTIANLVPLGHGVGSFLAAFPAWADAAIGAPMTATEAVRVAYNDPLHLIAEGGLAGLLPLALIAIALHRGLRDHDPTPLAILGALVGLACVNYPLHAPITGFVLAIAAGYLCRADAGLRAGAVDRRDAADGEPSQLRAEHQGLACAAGRGALAVFPEHSRSERTPGGDGAGYAAADRAAGAAQRHGPGARQSGSVVEIGARPEGLRRPGRRDRDGGGICPPVADAARKSGIA